MSRTIVKVLLMTTEADRLKSKITTIIIMCSLLAVRSIENDRENVNVFC
jgi:hypothetical protein